MNSIHKVFTEEPEEELWRALLQFSYRANIRRHFADRGIDIEDDEVVNDSIAGAIMQAYEYYKASKTVSLQIQPLLLYYGTTNLMYAMCILLSGKQPNISNHGMHISVADRDSYIADTKVNFDHESDGGIHIMAKQLGLSSRLVEYKDWTVGDFFSSIAEIHDDFIHCYSNKEPHILMLEIINTAEGIVEKAYIHSREEMIATLQKVDGFSASYLKPEFIEGRQGGQAYIALRHKMKGSDISLLSYSGQPYLQIAQHKSGKDITLPTELNMYISLFALSSLCRYHPEIWNPFVTQDTTGEKLLVEKLLYYSRRILPNAVLNRVLGKQIVYVSDKYVPDERIHLVGEHEVKEIVSNEVMNQLRREYARTATNRRN